LAFNPLNIFSPWSACSSPPRFPFFSPLFPNLHRGGGKDRVKGLPSASAPKFWSVCNPLDKRALHEALALEGLKAFYLARRMGALVQKAPKTEIHVVLIRPYVK